VVAVAVVAGATTEGGRESVRTVREDGGGT
jgi:hypothetical protein